MKHIAVLALCIALAACAAAPAVVVRANDPMPLFVAPACWQDCEASPRWQTAADGSADWDALGTDQPTIEQQKTVCNAARQACADALRRLEAAGVITLGSTPSQDAPQP